MTDGIRFLTDIEKYDKNSDGRFSLGEIKGTVSVQLSVTRGTTTDDL